MASVFSVLVALALAAPWCAGAEDRLGDGDPSRYDVVWSSPSDDHNGSVPLGNGDVTVNAWVEASGDLIFYIGKSDSWDENGRLLKVGRVRFSFDPALQTPLHRFEQTLDLRTATLRVRYGQGNHAVLVRVWVDAHCPVIRVEVESQTPTSVVATIELWRTSRLALPSLEVSDLLFGRKTKDGKQVAVIVEPDSVVTPRSSRIGWFHHNRASVGPELTATIQGLRGFARPDPLLHRTFGAVVTAERAEAVDSLHLHSVSDSHHLFNVFVHTQHAASPQEWLRTLDGIIAEAKSIPLTTSRSKHEAWWHRFWDRSWIHVTSADSSVLSTDQETFVVSRAYALQRFVNACAGRGAHPIKFNGSLLTVPCRDRPGGADYRQWGPGYWWQNTRLPYYGMPAAGDYDLMEPLFRMYGKELMPLFRYRTRLYLGHDGAFVPECIYFWGDVFSETYGWTPFEQRDDKLQESRWHKWEWVSGLELVWLMLDYYEYTLDENFLRQMVLPTASEILTFFDQHYPTDENGRMVMYPSQAAETWWDCTNPMPEVAGLHAVVDRLRLLPQKNTEPEQRRFWAEFKKKIPDLPVHTMGGTLMLAPAASFETKMNIENPELYAVFPFCFFGFNSPDKELALEAFQHRQDRGNAGWRQDDIFAAYLGLADTVREYLIGRARNKHADSRFPAFWGPNYDWVPDQTHGGVLVKALQAMVMQAKGKDIYLLPAWPEGWNVEFKLHAPFNTMIRGSYVNGKIETLSVTPSERREDIALPSFTPPSIRNP